MKKGRTVMAAADLILGLLLLFMLTGKMGQNESKAQQRPQTAVGMEETVPASGMGTGAVKDAAGEKKMVALTFDDGPHPTYTPMLLDGLAERNVKATFFITGENAETYPELVKRMSEEGHLIGNHTYSHIQLTKGNTETFRAELVKTNEIIKGITGKEVVYVRPPYGSWDKRFETELNMFPVLWTIDPLDWCSKDAAGVQRRVLSKIKENAIILMHDSYPSTITAALGVVDTLQKEGYTFVTVEDILFD